MAVELCEKNPQGEIGVLLYFTPEPRLKEIYFSFRGFGGQIPLTLEEMNQIFRYIRRHIGAWYEDPDRMFERQVQLQYYIEWPWEISAIRLVNYKEGKFRLGPNW